MPPCGINPVFIYMKRFQIILFVILGAILVGCAGDTTPAPASTRHKGISAADQKTKKGD